MIVPPFLQPGDKIALIAPARKIRRDELDSFLEQTKTWNFDWVFGKNLLAQHYQFAGTDEQRLSDFQIALDNPEIKAIVPARGGYGCMRIMDQLNWDQFVKYPKWICGFSDLTAFHSMVHNKLNTCTLHSCMPVDVGTNWSVERQLAVDSLFDALTGQSLVYESPEYTIARNGKFKGTLVGGNLTLLAFQLGSKSDIDTRGKVLFIEDIDEHFYHLDRMILAMKRAGKFEHLAGLICGGFTLMKDKDPANPFGKTSEEIIMEHVGEYNFPVITHFPAGHLTKNLCLQLGYNIIFDSNKLTLEADRTSQPIY